MIDSDDLRNDLVDLLEYFQSIRLSMSSNPEWNALLEALNSNDPVYRWDAEFAADRLVHLSCINIVTGEVNVNHVLDYGLTLDEMLATLTASGFTGFIFRMSQATLRRYYDGNQCSAIKRLPKITPTKLTDLLDSFGFKKSLVVEWSTIFCDISYTTACLAGVSRISSAPPRSRVVRGLIAIRSRFNLYHVIRFNLNYLFQVLFPNHELNRTHHLADIDMAKMILVIRWFIELEVRLMDHEWDDIEDGEPVGHPGTEGVEGGVDGGVDDDEDEEEAELDGFDEECESIGFPTGFPAVSLAAFPAVSPTGFPEMAAFPAVPPTGFPENGAFPADFPTAFPAASPTGFPGNVAFPVVFPTSSPGSLATAFAAAVPAASSAGNARGAETF